MKYLDKGAQLSECGGYRYTLWRVWDESRPHIAFVGLNPSTADALKDDPTIRRCVSFAGAAGFGAFTMLNLWAVRSTNPDILSGDLTPEEDENLAAIARVSANVARVCAVWGTHPMARRRYMAVLPLVDEWYCLRKTQEGMPAHPLYLPASCTMSVWRTSALAAKGQQ